MIEGAMAVSDTELIAIGVGAGVGVVLLFICSIVLVIVIKKKCRNKNKDPMSGSDGDNINGHDPELGLDGSLDLQLIDEDVGDDVSLTLQHVLNDDVWVDDMTGVMNHCIPILKGCHALTTQLGPITERECSSKDADRKVEEMALQVQPRLEDVVQLLEGPLDPRLVEARCTALYYAVSNLGLVVKGLCKDADGIADFIDTSLRDTESHLKVLQAETQRLRRRSLMSSAKEREDDTSGAREPSLGGTHSSSSSRGGSSHTDSTESGIDIQTPSEHGSEHSPHSPSSNYHPHSSSDSELKRKRYVSDADSDLHHCSTIAEVHMNGSEEQEEGIEMKSFTNGGFTRTGVEQETV